MHPGDSHQLFKDAEELYRFFERKLADFAVSTAVSNLIPAHINIFCVVTQSALNTVDQESYNIVQAVAGLGLPVSQVTTAAATASSRASNPAVGSGAAAPSSRRKRKP